MRWRWMLTSAWAAMLLSAVVVVPRSVSIVRQHSETMDEEYHLSRGVRFWTKSMGGRTSLNDPPLGPGLSALPLVVAGTDLWSHVLYGQRLSVETLQLLIAVWKSLLFLPLVGVAYLWARELYGVASAWIAAGLLTFEPALAAHIPLASIDVLGVEGIVIACWLTWRYVHKPTLPRACAVTVATAAAVMVKHTAIILPLVIIVYTLLNRVSPWLALRDASIAILAGLLALWAFTLFDFSQPHLPKSFKAEHPDLTSILSRRLPGGLYITSFVGGMTHAQAGHRAYLYGEVNDHGWWSYFPIVATYKVPIAIGLLAALALASLVASRPRWTELSLLLPLLAWAIFLIASKINIGWRHFLPAYVFMLLLCARAATPRHVAWKIFAAIAVIAVAIDSRAHHPNYISYMNWPRHKPYLAINDSNVDWGQSLKQIRRWLDEHPQEKPVYLRYFGRIGSPNIQHHLGDRVRVLQLDNRPPRTGILIISPFWEAGIGDPADRYRLLRDAQPIDVIGDSMRVYDLDRVKGWKAAHPRRAAATTTTSP